jgi:hypothetical protein
MEEHNGPGLGFADNHASLDQISIQCQCLSGYGKEQQNGKKAKMEKTHTSPLYHKFNDTAASIDATGKLSTDTIIFYLFYLQAGVFLDFFRDKDQLKIEFGRSLVVNISVSNLFRTLGPQPAMASNWQ